MPKIKHLYLLLYGYKSNDLRKTKYIKLTTYYKEG